MSMWQSAEIPRVEHVVLLRSAMLVPERPPGKRRLQRIHSTTMQADRRPERRGQPPRGVISGHSRSLAARGGRGARGRRHDRPRRRHRQRRDSRRAPPHRAGHRGARATTIATRGPPRFRKSHGWRSVRPASGSCTDLKELAEDPASAGVGVVISGHSHRPRVERRAGLLLLNPGSAGPRRFSLPVAVARLHLAPAGPRAEIVELAVGRPGPGITPHASTRP